MIFKTPQYHHLQPFLPKIELIMNELTNSQKKEWAEMLFVKENLTQKEIARRIGVSEQTITKWVNTESWEKSKFTNRVIRVQNIQSLQRQLVELNETIEAREKGKRFASSKEMDAIIKLTKAIEILEDDVTVREIIAVFMEYFDWLRAVELDEAKRQMPYHDQFVKSQISKR